MNVRVRAERGLLDTAENNVTVSADQNRFLLTASIEAVKRKQERLQCQTCRPDKGSVFLFRALEGPNSEQLIERLRDKRCRLWQWGSGAFDLATVHLLLEMAAYAGDKLHNQFRVFLLDFLGNTQPGVVDFFQDRISVSPSAPDTFEFAMKQDLRAASEQFQQPRREFLQVQGERAQYRSNGDPISARDQLKLWFRVGAVPGTPAIFGCFVDSRILVQNQIAFTQVKGMLEPLAKKPNFRLVGMMRGGFYLSKLIDKGFIGSNILQVAKAGGQEDYNERHARKAIEAIVDTFDLLRDPNKQVDVDFLDAYMGGQTSIAYAKVFPALLSGYPNVIMHMFWIRENMHLRRTEPASISGPLGLRYRSAVVDVNWIVGDDMPCIVEDQSEPITKQALRLFNNDGAVVQTHRLQRDESSFHLMKRLIWGAMQKLVTIKVIRATGLRNPGSVSRVDPHCVIRVGARDGGQAVSTTIKEDTADPVWNEDLTVVYDVVLESMQPYLEFIVFDSWRRRVLGTYKMGSERFLSVGLALPLQLVSPSMSGDVGTLHVQVIRIQDSSPQA